jgi:vancomycin permeability regulator SanA
MSIATLTHSRFFRYTGYTLVVIVVWFVSHTIVSTYIGMRDLVEPSDIIVVFGNTVLPSGEPSPRLKSRLDKGIELFKTYKGPYILVSGGFGKEGFDEASVMAKYMQDQGVPEDRILVDHQGINTQATVDRTVQIMREKDLHSIVAVSQYHHLPRAILTFKKAGVTAIYHAHADITEYRDVYALVRECIAFYTYLLK